MNLSPNLRATIFIGAMVKHNKRVKIASLGRAKSARHLP